MEKTKRRAVRLRVEGLRWSEIRVRQIAGVRGLHHTISDGQKCGYCNGRERTIRDDEAEWLQEVPRGLTYSIGCRAQVIDCGAGGRD